MNATFVKLSTLLQYRVLPPRVSEIVGVCHLKAFIYDDNVLMTGANLSNTYFSNRQDRWAVALSQHI